MRFAVVLASCLVPGAALAQSVAKQYAAPVTDGLAIPGTSISTEFDARAATFNAGGLALLRGSELALALDEQDLDYATSGGPGFGAYLATVGGGESWPRLGVGMGLEWLRPPRSELSPDPGEPFRFTLSAAIGLGKHAGFGVSWHHFHDDGVLEGVDTFDLGLAVRLHDYVGFGATLTDIATNPIDGVPIERRYTGELSVRPLGTDRLELAGGVRIGETRGDVDAWGRATVKVARGVYAMADFEDRELLEIDELPAGPTDRDVREYRATLGVEVAIGNAGILASATGVRDPTGANHALGGTFVARYSAVAPESVLGTSDHVERLDLSGEIDLRALTRLVMRLRQIEHDDSVKAVLVMFDGVDAGWGTLEEIRDELLLVRKAHKKVFAYMTYGTGRDYFVATAADKIFVDPSGGIRLVGMAGQSFYFRGLLDLVGVVPEFEKIAEYKSAPEQLTEHGATPLAAKMHADLFDSIYDHWLAAIAEGRHLPIAEVQQLVDHGPYDAGELAQNTKLVDAVAAPDKVSLAIGKEVGEIAVAETEIPRPERWTRPRVAVIYVDGDITDGESKSVPVVGQQVAGGQTLIAAVSEARSDPGIGAIVLRIDSPGGSALASELIAREVFATHKIKPILCSFSNTAASGGYFVAAGCDKIFAEQMTITGSIGIFSGKADLSGLAHKLGIDIEIYKHGDHADSESLFRSYTDDERADLLVKLRYMYSRFVGAVAEGRGMSKDAVDAVGRGHVYTGAQAQPIKLVDAFGGLGDAIEEAKQRMGVSADTKIEIVELPKPPKSMFGTLGRLLGIHADTATTIPFTELPLVKEILRGIPASVLLAPSTPQARLPVDIRFTQ
jgi:protease-4